MGADYIPEQDNRAASWMKQFARAVVNDPASYRVTIEDATNMETAVTAFRLSLVVARRPISRTIITVAQKNADRKLAEAKVRPLAQWIRRNGEISDVLKMAAGLRPVIRRARVVAPPASVPMLHAKSDRSNAVQIQVRDSQQSGSSAIPKDAAALQVFVCVTDGIASGGSPMCDANGLMGDWKMAGTFTRWPITLRPAASAGWQTFTYVARWVNRRGETGGFGRMTSVQVFTSTLPRGHQPLHTRAA